MARQAREVVEETAPGALRSIFGGGEDVVLVRAPAKQIGGGGASRDCPYRLVSCVEAGTDGINAASQVRQDGKLKLIASPRKGCS